MTDREIKRMEKSLPGWENGKPPVRTEEQKRLAEELWCRGMINSILTYHQMKDIEPGAYYYGQYLKKYEKTLGSERVRELCEEQLDDFRKAVVRFAGYDGEGVSYNSVIWADEMVDEVMELLEHDLAAEGPENGTGWTLPDGKYHIFAYVDFIDDERVVVLEPNKVVHGAHEPIFGDTFIVAFGDVERLKRGVDWCLEQFACDRHGIDALLDDATQRSCVSKSDGLAGTKDCIRE